MQRLRFQDGGDNDYDDRQVKLGEMWEQLGGRWSRWGSFKWRT